MPRPMTEEAYQLFHQGTFTLARVEANGVKVDTGYLTEAIGTVQGTIAALEDDLRNSKEWRAWKKMFGDRAKLSSREQLGELLFDRLDVNPKPARTATGRWATDNRALIDLDSQFVQSYIGVEKWRKVLSTNLIGLVRELSPDGYVHCSYNLASGADEEGGGARSFRSSCNGINFQNQPVRDPEVGKIVRRLYVPRKKGWVIGETDYSGIEVKVGCCYHHDPQMVRYVTDPTTDMHRDMARQLFRLSEDLPVPHECRHAAKNMFVFPQFYGSYYIACAKALWAEMGRRKTGMCRKGDDPKKPTGDSTVLEHLARAGVKKLGACDPDFSPAEGTFEAHVQKIERDFWERRFRTYGRWKKETYAKYLRTGFVKFHTGFVCHDIMSRNQSGNRQIQGSAYHCQLKSMILADRELRRQKFETLLIGTVHDSTIWEGPESESSDVRGLLEEIMTKQVPRLWDWITVPLEVEHEVAPPGESWHAKRKVK